MANLFVENLAGGMNLKTNPIILKDIETELIINYNLDTVGSLTKRNGYDVFASQPADSKRVIGLFQYTNISVSAETTQVMVANNAADTQAVIYYNNSGTWTSSKADDTVAPGTGGADATNFQRARFATFLDYILRVNGQDAVASSVNVNGGAWGTTNAPTTILPAFIAVFQDRVYVANNRQTGASRQGSRLYFSSLPGATITWTTASDYVDINPDDGDEITALENNGNKLLVFKNRALYRWDYGQTEADRLIGVGTESQECVKTNLDLGITFFANSNGVYAYTGGRPRLISRKIQSLIEAVPAANWNDAVAEVDKEHYYLYLGDSITLDATVYTNVMAVYNIPLDAWVIYTLNTPWRVANKLILSGAEEIYFGSSRGRTYKWNSGLEDDSGGASESTAVNISSEITSKEYLLTYPSYTNFEYADFISKNALQTKTFYKLDRKGDWQTLVTLDDRFKTSRHIGKDCRSVQIRLTDNSNLASRIDGFNLEHSPQRKRK